ncbi:MAG: Flp pilus assembly complex ATPase component TadA [Oscillospiraceae bacterium]|nr:Flp pilus assembly complex ATPase component TadA [Oscillospiraceae bacterium]
MIAARTWDIPLKTAAELVKPPQGAEKLCEIRLRAGRRAAAVMADGRISSCSDILTRDDIEACFQELCRHSVHSYAREIREGYITLPGGHRAGFCGTAVMQDGKLVTLRDISSINIRLAREIKGCGEELYNAVFRNGLRSLLIVGKPMSGKTTILRDLARLLGARHRVALIDSRDELAASHKGTPTLDVGENTDVLSGYPRTEGIMIALRTLSPDIILCDEISGDTASIKHCLNCGVKLLATIHADSVDELYSDTITRSIAESFDSIAVLGSKGALAEIRHQRKGAAL